MGTLYIVSTPIGNLQDITIRAVSILFEVGVVAAENRTSASKLLFHIKNKYPQLITSPLSPKLVSMNEFEEEMKIPEVIDYLRNDTSVAYISEAGTPLLSDPGFKLVREARKKGIPVVTIPGASAITAALSVSGLPTDKFLFLGFLPKGTGKRVTFLENTKKSLQELTTNHLNATVVIFESPHRVLESFKDMHAVFGDITLTIARELTKIHEETITKSVSEFISQWEAESPRGEFVIMFHL